MNPRLANAPDTAVEVDLAEQMRIMDALPARLKRLVWLAPVKLDMRQIRDARNRHARRGTDPVAYLVRAITRDYPEWRPF